MLNGNHDLDGEARVLSLDVRSHRVGYVVFEGPCRLLDWGVIRNRAALVQSLLDTFEPSVIVLRTIARGSIRDRSIVRVTIRRISRKAKAVSISSVFVSRAQTARLFCQHVNPTKQEIAGTIAECFPELASRLPPRRKPWKAEHWNMCLFDSVAHGLAYFAESVDAQAVNELLTGSKSFRRPLGGVAR